MKCKIFDEFILFGQSKDFEKEINKWLGENSQITVVQVLQSSASAGGAESTSVFSVVSIFYKPQV